MTVYPKFFDAAWYLAVYPDVAASGMAPGRHYLRYGRYEGRRPCALIAADRERDMLLGLAPIDALQALLAGPDLSEQVWARLALARQALRGGDLAAGWPKAQALLAPLSLEDLAGFGLLGPVLLAAEAALVCGARARAKALLSGARRWFGWSLRQALRGAGSEWRDLALARANLAWPAAPIASFSHAQIAEQDAALSADIGTTPAGSGMARQGTAPMSGGASRGDRAGGLNPVPTRLPTGVPSGAALWRWRLAAPYLFSGLLPPRLSALPKALGASAQSQMPLGAVTTASGRAGLHGATNQGSAGEAAGDNKALAKTPAQRRSGSEPAAFDRLAAPFVWRRRGGPLLSVIMPARNAAATIDTALRGLRAQSWRDLEILVVDNGSQDATAAIAAQHGAADPRIRLIDGQAARGAYGARNLGLAAATGAFITTHDADDWAHPARSARQMRPLLRHPEVMATLSYFVRITPDLRVTRWWGGDSLAHPNMSSLLFRRQVFDELGFWDEVKGGADSEYLARIRASYGGAAVKEVSPGLPLSLGRFSQTSLSQASATSVQSLWKGARRSYGEAAAAWHRAAVAADQKPYMAQFPLVRPFAAPPQMLPERAAALMPESGQMSSDGDGAGRARAGGPLTAPSADPWARLSASAQFDGDWCRQCDPRLRLLGLDPAAEFLSQIEGLEGELAAAVIDPGPLFSVSGYAVIRAQNGESRARLSLADLLARLENPAPCLPDLKGALPDTGAPRVLIFGHRAGAEVFGAERSLLDMLERVAAAGLVPLAVLPAAGNPDYRAAVLAKCHTLYIRPYFWRYGGLVPPARTLAVLSDLIAQSGAAEVHSNTLVLDAPVLAAAKAGVPAAIWVRELPASDPQLCRDLGLKPDALRAELIGSGARLIANSAPVAVWLGAGAADRAGAGAAQGTGEVITLPNPIDPALFALAQPSYARALQEGGFSMPPAPLAVETADERPSSLVSSAQPQEPPGAPQRPDVPRAKIALIGSLSARKGLNDMVLLARSLPQADFVLIGPDSAELAALRAAGRLPLNLLHLGYFPSSASALAEADLVLSLSRFAESFGRTVAEALAAGRPVICWDHGAPPDLVGPQGQAGRVVALGDLPGLRAAVLDLLRPGRFLAASAAARARALELAAINQAVPNAALFPAALAQARRAAQHKAQDAAPAR